MFRFVLMLICQLGKVLEGNTYTFKNQYHHIITALITTRSLLENLWRNRNDGMILIAGQSLYHGFPGAHTCIERQTGKTHYRSTHVTNVHKRTYTQTRTQEQLAGGGGGTTGAFSNDDAIFFALDVLYFVFLQPPSFPCAPSVRIPFYESNYACFSSAQSQKVFVNQIVISGNNRKRWQHGLLRSLVTHLVRYHMAYNEHFRHFQPHLASFCPA